MSFDVLLSAIREKNTSAIVASVVDSKTNLINPSYRTENEILDYKEKLPMISAEAIEWAELAKDILAFHNTRQGGILLFGVKNEDYSIEGLSTKTRGIDSKIVNDKVRKYVGDQLWVEMYNPIPCGNKELAILIIPPCFGSLKRFLSNGPIKKGKNLFLADGSAIRKHDSSVTLSPEEADKMSLSDTEKQYGLYRINTGNYRLLAPDNDFIRREKYCEEIKKGLSKSRVACVTLTGIGGIGKTSLAVWAVNEEYVQKNYDYIVSITAKDRELTSSGIQAMYQHFTTLNDLLNAIAEVIGFPDIKELPLQEKEKEIRTLIENSNMLLFLDNLETTSDDSIKTFINDLPDGVKAIITSRRNIVNVSSYPIEIGGLEDEEIVQLINTYSKQYKYSVGLTREEKLKIGQACNSIPLAIRWIISRCSTIPELLTVSSTLLNNNQNNAELLEFVFRRTFDNMDSIEKHIMQVLSVVPDIPEEAIIKGHNKVEDDILGTLQRMVQDTIVIKRYDPEISWYRYSLLPLTREFIIRNALPSTVEKSIRDKLTAWYQADDISNPEEKVVVQQMRQNGQNVGAALTSLAQSATRRGDLDSAKKLFEMALARDPNNWSVYRAYGDYYRKNERSTTRTIQYYKAALEKMPSSVNALDAAVLNREFAMVFMNSGERSALDKSIECLRFAHSKMPADPITAKFLGECYYKKGHYTQAIELLTPFLETKDKKTQVHIWPLLLQCYSASPARHKMAIVTLRDKMKQNGIAEIK